MDQSWGDGVPQFVPRRRVHQGFEYGIAWSLVLAVSLRQELGVPYNT
jgi:hypothetical protein